MKLQFHSYPFVFLFLPVCLTGYYLLKHLKGGTQAERKKCLQNWLIAASLVFYASFGLRMLAIFSLSIVWNFLLGSWMAATSGGRRRLLTLGVAGNLCLLLYFKYADLFWGLLREAAGPDGGRTAVFPVAISFYTFQQISFLTDVYRGDAEASDLREYLLYILFFPKLLQGPIIRFNELQETFDGAERRGFDAEIFCRGALLFTLGLAKKVLLAETIGAGVDYGYANAGGLTWLDAVLTAVGYALQLYFDFSGYCDMAQGVCWMLGLGMLPVNFNSPYQAENIYEHWKRWHRTLTRFFTDYVYLPLGGSRRGNLRTYGNIFLIFVLSGLWHGAGLTYLAWGMLHGVLYTAYRAWKRRARGTESLRTAAKRRDVSEEGRAPRLLDALRHARNVLLTFLYVTGTLIFFRAQTMADAAAMLGRLAQRPILRVTEDFAECFQMDEIWYVLKLTPLADGRYGVYLCMWMVLLFSGILVFGCRNALQISRRCKITPAVMCGTAVLFVWSVLSFGEVSTFLYVNF